MEGRFSIASESCSVLPLGPSGHTVDVTLFPNPAIMSLHTAVTLNEEDTREEKQGIQSGRVLGC